MKASSAYDDIAIHVQELVTKAALLRPKPKTAKVPELHKKGLSKQDIAKACEIGVASVYRILKASSVSRLATTTSK
jgi:DNA invertase Pin-like site-specific DNA recombinase